MLAVVNEARTILQSLLQAIDNGVPVWDVRKFLIIAAKLYPESMA